MHKQPTSFRRRVATAVVMLVCVTLSVAAVAVWGVIRIHEDSTIALRGYRQLREVYEVGVYVAQARQNLQTHNAPAIQRDLDLAITRLNLFATAGDGWLNESRAVQGDLRRDLGRASGDANSAVQAESLDRSLSELATLASQVRTSVEGHQAAAAHERKVTLILIAVFAAAFVLLAILIGLLHYRTVMNPIDALASAVRAFASGHLDRRVAPHGDREFALLARDLNQMAEELQALYRELERKVERKSRELVRSERLASVGYLAAGVAHEINNPLGIIAAYAERALQRLRRSPSNPASIDHAQQAFEIICEEAFRCKDITDRLLSMARSGSDAREPLSIGALAQDVVSMLRDLPQFKHVNLALTCEGNLDELIAPVNDAQIKQVLLNLLVNAAEAIEQRDGAIRVIVRRSQEMIEIVVQDNGQGMNADTIDRVFEPFFSQRKSNRDGVLRHGTGLGLSICHAIVQSHGGQLSAASDGVGRGSRFVATLPIGIAPGKEVARART